MNLLIHDTYNVSLFAFSVGLVIRFQSARVCPSFPFWRYLVIEPFFFRGGGGVIFPASLPAVPEKKAK